MIKMIAEKFIFALSLFSLASLSAPTRASAGENWVRYQDYKINLEVPKDWKIERDLYGMPLTVLGPERNGERAVLNIQHTPLRQFRFDHKLIQATQDQYFAGRKEWLEDLDNTRFISEIPYEKLSANPRVDGFQLGFRYEMRGQEFEERSIQIVCNERMYFVKTLYSSKEPAADKKALADIVQKLNCATVIAKDGPYVPSNLQDLDVKFERKYGTQWPTQQQLKSASAETKAVMLESVVEFYKKFEEGAGEELYSANQQQFRDIMKRLQLPFSEEAFATEGFDCFFGGWPSKFVKKGGRLTCGSPADTNPDYASASGACGVNQLACNPALFGKDVCISVTSAAERSHATLRCEAGFKKNGKTYEDIVKDPSFNDSLFQQTIQSAEGVCSEEAYATGNYGLCSVLKDKLNLSISGGKKTADENDNLFINRLDSVKPENYDQTVSSALDNYAEFEKRCFDDKNNFKPDEDPNMDPVERDRCIQDLNAMADDLNKVDNMHQQVEQVVTQEDQGGTSPVDPNLQNQNCADGNFCGSKPQGSAATANPAAASSCTKDELGRIKSETCSFSTYMAAFGSAGVAMVKSLIGSVKFLAELAKDAVVYVKDKIVQGWNWLWGSKKVENQTANKAHQASTTSNSFLSQLKKDPWGTIANLFKAMVDGFSSFVKNDVFCQKWSDWKQTKCLIPGNSWECLSCQAKVKGIGTAVGYIAGEFLPAVLTGGAMASAGKIAEFLKAGKAAGKLAKIGAELAAKFPRMAKAAKAVAETTKLTVSAARKTKVVKWTGQILTKTKRAYRVTKVVIGRFKSKVFGKYKDLVAGINKLRQKHWAYKAGIWVAKQPVNLVKAAGKLVTAPVRLPVKYVTKPIIKAQKATFNFVLKGSERILNTTSISASAIKKAQFVGVALPYVKYAGGLNENIKTARIEEGKTLQNVGSWEKVLPKITKGQDLTESELKDFADYNNMTIPQAKLELIDGKLTLLQQGNKVSISDEEIRLYAENEAAKTGSDPKIIEATLKNAIETSRQEAR
jgi:hypothetical protein